MIEFTLHPTHQRFTFDMYGIPGSAHLELPTLPGSIKFDGKILDQDSLEFKLLHQKLRTHLFRSFKDENCAYAALALADPTVYHVEEHDEGYYVAFTEKDDYLLQQGTGPVFHLVVVEDDVLGLINKASNNLYEDVKKELRGKLEQWFWNWKQNNLLEDIDDALNNIIGEVMHTRFHARFSTSIDTAWAFYRLHAVSIREYYETKFYAAIQNTEGC